MFLLKFNRSVIIGSPSCCCCCYFNCISGQLSWVGVFEWCGTNDCNCNWYARNRYTRTYWIQIRIQIRSTRCAHTCARMKWLPIGPLPLAFRLTLNLHRRARTRFQTQKTRLKVWTKNKTIIFWNQVMILAEIRSTIDFLSTLQNASSKRHKSTLESCYERSKHKLRPPINISIIGYKRSWFGKMQLQCLAHFFSLLPHNYHKLHSIQRASICIR